MPFYIRKSVSAGPFRLNFSKGGVGTSVGVKGFRVGTGPRGHYVHAGRGGLYYRASVGRAGQARTQPSTIPDSRPNVAHTDGVVMVEVESDDVLQMRDSAVADLLDDMNQKAARTRWARSSGGPDWSSGCFSRRKARPSAPRCGC